METILNSLVNDQVIYYGILSSLIVILMMLIIMIMNQRETIINNTIKQPVQQPEIEPIVLVEEEPIIETAKTDLEKVLNDMRQGATEKVPSVTTFEQQQEEKAIISYQELLNNKPKLQFEEPMSVEYDETNDLDFTNIKPAIDSELDFAYAEKVEQPKKWQNSEFISPVYGRVENKTEYPTIKSFYDKSIPHFDDVEEVIVPRAMVNKPKPDLEQTLNIEPLKEEIKKNDQFLDSLKEFRKNLE